MTKPDPKIQGSFLFLVPVASFFKLVLASCDASQFFSFFHVLCQFLCLGFCCKLSHLFVPDDLVELIGNWMSLWSLESTLCRLLFLEFT
jgi:hypothetical protein